MGLLQNGFTDDSENLTLGVVRNIGIDLGAHFIGVHDRMAMTERKRRFLLMLRRECLSFFHCSAVTD